MPEPILVAKAKSEISRISRLAPARRCSGTRSARRVTVRANPKLNVERAITELGVGEALISLLDERGRPTVVERAFAKSAARSIGSQVGREIVRGVLGSIFGGGRRR